jgi:Phospholipase/Carboxylesterase
VLQLYARFLLSRYARCIIPGADIYTLLLTKLFTMELSLITIPPSAPLTHTVAFLHGRGDKDKNFSFCVVQAKGSKRRSLRESFPSFRWVFPQCERRESASFPGTKAFQWFDIWNTSNFTQREEVQAPGLRKRHYHPTHPRERNGSVGRAL